MKGTLAMWTLDACLDVTPAGRAALDAIKERTTRRPMLLCSVCDAPLREAFDNETGEE